MFIFLSLLAGVEVEALLVLAAVGAYLALPRRGGARCRGRRGGRVVVRGRLSLVPVAVDV